jgi:hypothetical protein
VVIYLSDGDLTQAQFQVVTELTTIGKPMLLALNKADRYTDQELTMLHTRLSQRVAGLPQVAGKIQVVPVVSGGMREVIKEYPDGRILRELRPIPANTHELRLAIQRVADRDPEMLDRLRDQAIFALAAQSLDQALVDRQREQADAMIASYSRKAVVGALAAVTPGMDLAVQGYLGYQLVKELGKIYQASLREVDIEQFLRSCDRHIIGATPILLTLTGNVLKSFPGLGTVAGGLCHAVAYGLIFDTLGRAVANTLEQRGELAINPAVQHFDTGIAQDLETRLRHWFKIVMAIQSRPPTSPTAEKAQPGI